jgi:hypothetical protein
LKCVKTTSGLFGSHSALGNAALNEFVMKRALEKRVA